MSELKNWLTLCRVPDLGLVTFQKLINEFGSPDTILRANRNQLKNLGVPKKTIDGIIKPNYNDISQDLDWLDHPLHHIIALDDKRYPKLLKAIVDPPPLLYLIGEKQLADHLLSEPQIAIVGSRNSTKDGKQIAANFAQNLADAGIVITSGLSNGIDGAAHRGALLSKVGATIAITACGLDRVYPANHLKLTENIAERGIVISEFPIGTPPIPKNFFRRSRVISGLSLGVLVVEASVKSGSLITARYAADQNREVFAIPGSIHSPLSKGCHELIRNGAKLVETVSDIMMEIKDSIDFTGPVTQSTSLLPNTLENTQHVDPDHELILNVMGYKPINFDTLVKRSGLSPNAVSSILLILELNGEILHNAQGIYTRAYLSA